MGYLKICKRPDGKTTYKFDTRITGKRIRKRVTCYASDVKALYKQWEKDLISDYSGDYKLFEKLDEFLIHSKIIKPNRYKHFKTIIEQAVKLCFSNDMKLNDFKIAHVDDFINYRRLNPLQGYHVAAKKGKVTNSTINKSLSVLSCFFNWCIRKEYYRNINPCSLARLEENNKREVRLTGEQITELLEKASEVDIRMYQLIIFELLTGMRRGEILKLKWSEVDFDNNRIVVIKETTKGKKTRITPISDTLRKLILTIKNNNEKSKLLFESMSRTMFQRRWYKIRENISFPVIADGSNFTFRDLRHVFGQYLLDMGVPMEDISVLLGHSSIKVTQDRYVMFARPDLHRKVKVLEDIMPFTKEPLKKVSGNDKD